MKLKEFLNEEISIKEVTDYIDSKYGKKGIEALIKKMDKYDGVEFNRKKHDLHNYLDNKKNMVYKAAEKLISELEAKFGSQTKFGKRFSKKEKDKIINFIYKEHDIDFKDAI